MLNSFKGIELISMCKRLNILSVSIKKKQKGNKNDKLYSLKRKQNEKVQSMILITSHEELEKILCPVTEQVMSKNNFSSVHIAEAVAVTQALLSTCQG